MFTLFFRPLRLTFALLLLCAGVAFAQTDLPGVPAEWQALLALAITGLSGWLVVPLTALSKRLGCTKGPTTVLISAALSLAVTLGIHLWQAYEVRGDLPWPQALWSALGAFVVSQGLYWMRRLSQGNVTPQVGPVIGEVQPPADVKQAPPSGFEPMTGLTGVQGFAGLPAVATGLLSNLIADVLREAKLLATPEQVMRVALALAPVAPDLLDGDVHLSAENRNRILRVVMDLKATGTL